MKRTPLTTTAVVEEAAALADEIGFDAVTVSAVARRLGVQTPSLYSHVRDLAALRDGITELALSDLCDRISVGVAGRSGRLALYGFAAAHRDLAAESPGKWESLQRRAGRPRSSLTRPAVLSSSPMRFFGGIGCLRATASTRSA